MATLPIEKGVDYVADMLTTLEQDLLSMDGTITKITSKREKLINKLDEVIDKMELDTEDSSKGASTRLLAKTALLNTYSALLDQQEKSSINRVNIKTKQQELLQDRDKSETFTEILKVIKSSPANIESYSIDSAISNINDTIHKLSITVMDTELRDDPLDIS